MLVVLSPLYQSLDKSGDCGMRKRFHLARYEDKSIINDLAGIF